MNRSDRIKWFEEARFGMFIHWGIYSIPGRGEWVMLNENIPAVEYNRFAGQFNPHRYCPEEWVALAKAAGMKYMVMSAKHHDGFALFDSKVSNFTSLKTAARRDLVAEYVKACRKGGLKAGLYFSLPDWQWPAFFRGKKKDPAGWARFIAYVHSQVRELCTNYGKIDILWYDYMAAPGRSRDTAEDWDAKKMNAMVRRLQPNILINDRSGLPEDFDTPEQRISASDAGRMWESCMTMNTQWGYFPADTLYKPAKELIHKLTACATGGGNLLLNVGPKPNGTIPAPQIERLKEIGKWLYVNGESIYGTKRSSFNTGTSGCASEGKNCTYVYVHWWPGKTLVLPSVKEKIKSAYILSTKRKLSFERKGERIILKNLPEKPPDKLTTVIVLKK